MEVVEALSDPRNHPVVGTTFLEECRLIMTVFEMTRLAHCPREANNAAHTIARSVVDVRNVWIKDTPLFLYLRRQIIPFSKIQFNRDGLLMF